MITPHLTRPLICLRSDDRSSVGGKAASLGELARAGLPVPAGFAVTTAAFGHALEAIDPGGAIPRRVGGAPPDEGGAAAGGRAPPRGRGGDPPAPARRRPRIA